MTVAPTVLLRRGDRGRAVLDVQHRLAGAGFASEGDEPGAFETATEAAVRAFQTKRGLRVDGLCGPHTWAALVEAGFHLGDRLLYLRSPMVRGDDVTQLQRALGALGFDAGRVDGILGPDTAQALVEFQRNSGLTSDGICGPETVRELARFGRGEDAGPTVATVREVETLRASTGGLRGRRLAIGEAGGLWSLADTLGKELGATGAVVSIQHHPDESAQAAQANDFRAELYLGLRLAETGCAAAYYAAPGFESAGGRRLADLVARAGATALASWATGSFHPDGTAAEGLIRGMRLPILRETRMPAVLCELGPATAVVERSGELVTELAGAVARWAQTPVEG